MIRIGEGAPDFTVPGANGRIIQRYSLSESLEDGPVVLLFYPFDFGPICATGHCGFKEAEWLTIEEGVDVWGISPDSAYSHRRFVREYDLKFPLLCDRLGAVADSYGVLLEEFEDHSAVPTRSIVAVDGEQVVRYVWRADAQYDTPSIDVLEEAIGWRDERSSRDTVRSPPG